MAIDDFWRPTKQQLVDAHGKGIRDIIAPNLKILFVGINPGLYTAAIGRHFGRPGNRFWPALHRGGFTDRQFSPFESDELLSLGFGITNIVNYATNAADELTKQQLLAGAKILERKVKKFRPRWAAIVGIGAYRDAFERPQARVGLQDESIGGAKVWVLPNPSGLNANHTPTTLAKLFKEFRDAVERGD